MLQKISHAQNLLMQNVEVATHQNELLSPRDTRNKINKDKVNPNLHSVQLLLAGAPQRKVEVLATTLSRGAPRRGSEGHRRPKAEEAGARGYFPHPDKLI